MVRLYLMEDSRDYEKGFRELLKFKGYEAEASKEDTIGVSFACSADAPRVIRVDYASGKAKITAGERVFLFRGLMTLIRILEKQGPKQEISYSEKILIPKNGVMADCSRNSVLKVESVKQLLCIQASLGMRTLMLYTEDTYEVPEYPYFGAYRGRYTKEELRQIDEYADALGIEVVPCIQALAHLATTLRWPQMLSLRDTEDILLAGSEEVYTFLDACIRTISECFQTRRIHLGMDEAWSLGLGTYLHKNGYHPKSEIMKEHLQKVLEICKRYGLQPMMWSDMYFRIMSDQGEYYDVPLDREVREEEKPPRDVTMVYWDYYHTDSRFYEDYIQMHRKLGEKTILAGGIWTWNGIAPNYTSGCKVSKAALSASVRAGLEEVFCTMWQDDGAETPIFSGLPALVYFAEQGFEREQEENSEIKTAEQFEFLTGWSYDDFWLLDRFDCITGCETKKDLHYDNPSKFLFYQDPLSGMYDGQISKLSMQCWYEKLYEDLKGAWEKRQHVTQEGKATELQKRMDGIMEYYLALAQVLAVKAELGLRLRAAYQEGNREILRDYAKKEIPECVRLAEEAIEKRRAVWMRESKIAGFEVLDIRFAGVAARLRSAGRRLLEYLESEVESLPELEQEMLVIRPMQEGEDRVLCSCNAWRHIVTAGLM